MEDLSNKLDIKGRENILDAGCGSGLVIEKVIEENKGKGISITGLDLSSRMIKHAHRRCKNFSNVELQVADLNRNLEFPNSFFDKVICSNTLYALENPHRVILILQSFKAGRCGDYCQPQTKRRRKRNYKRTPNGT